MTPEERQLIGDLFERMRSTGLSEKDRDAEALINQSVRATPDASYKMVQSVLVQENALQEAGYRIEDLEARVRELEDHIAQLQPQQRSASGGFLGGLFGGSKPQQRESSVPVTGQRYQQPASSGSPWGGQQNRAPMQQGGYGQPQQGGYGQQQPQQAAGGGFMRSAMTTAAGVAGGMLAAGAIRDMMNSGGAKAQAAEQNQSASTPAQEASPYEVANEEPSSSYDSSDSDSGWDSGGDGDSDI